jgi:hypothetical protein
MVDPPAAEGRPRQAEAQLDQTKTKSVPVQTLEAAPEKPADTIAKRLLAIFGVRALRNLLRR